MKLISTNPAANYEPVGEVDVSTDQEITQKLAAAQAVKGAWKELGVSRRIELLTSIRDEFQRRADELAVIISKEVGKPITESKAEVQRYIDGEVNWFLAHGEEALAPQTTLKDDESFHQIMFEPYGVASVIAPWNFPFGMAMWGIIPNLIAGNTVVFKTSEECPLTGRLIEEIMHNHELPAGVFAQVYGAGEVGRNLSQGDVDLLWFTGSVAVGKEQYAVAAKKFKKAILEMGGSNPCIVFEDVDIAEAAPVIFGARFRNNGQVCSSLKRLIVHESQAEELMTALQKIMEHQVVGDPMDPRTTVGSLVAQRQQVLLMSQLQDALDKGATIVAQAKIPHGLKGAFFPPTILSGITPDMRVWHEEVFGPILPVVTFKTEEEAVALANDTEYGLGARVMSRDKKRAYRVASRLEAGSISINTELRFMACDPFGGYKHSGMGRERGIHGMQELCQIKTILDCNDTVYAEA